MRILTILLITYLTVPPLFGQSSDRIEMSRDVEYYRNTGPDTPLPDVYMPVNYPELTDSTLNIPLSLDKWGPEQRKALQQNVILDPYEFLLPVPGVSRRISDQKLSDLFLKCSARTGMLASLEQNMKKNPSEIFFSAYTDWPDRNLSAPQWISGGYHYQDRSDIKTGAAFRSGTKNSLYGFGSFKDSYSSPVFQFIPDLFCVLRSGREGVEEIRSNIRTDLILTDNPWSPRVELEGGGYCQDEFPNGDYRIRGGVGASGRGGAKVISNGEAMRFYPFPTRIMIIPFSSPEKVTLFS